jgi:hypothetical protein
MTKVNQAKEIKVKVGKSTLVLNDLDDCYSVGAEFNIQLSDKDLIRILTKNPDIAHLLFQWGGSDTEVGDNLFRALVTEVMEQPFSVVKANNPDNYYDDVEKKAKEKGYTIYEE